MYQIDFFEAEEQWNRRKRRQQLQLMMMVVFSQRIWMRFDFAGCRIVDACIYDFTIGT